LFSTPLNVAAALGDENCVDVLLAAGADVELKDMVGPSRVWAARSGHAGIIARLAAAGVEINGTDCRVLGTWGRTPLAIAAMRGHVDAVRALLQAGAKPDSRSPGAGTHADDRTWSWTPLMYAARGGHAEVVKTLIAARANVHAKTTSNRGDVLYRKGTSVLMIAAMYGRAGVVRRLIAAGANVNDADDSGCSALLLACTRGCDAATVKLLIDAGASRKFSKPGTTASSLLGEAARYATPEIIDALMQAGERFVYGMGFYGSTLEAAIVYPQRAANVAAYVRHGVDVNRPDLFGKTPLMLAAAGWHDAMLQALIEAGADVNLKNAVAYMPHPGGAMNADDGYTALIQAARYGTPGGIRLLLRAGALVDNCSPDGRTALMHAVANARTDNVRALLQGGADCRRKSLAGETALGIAKGFGLLEVALMLQQHMASQ
jgi:ankyrin repeat protein